MAHSTCIKCGGTRFEMVEVEPAASKYKMMFIQCSSCGGVVGVTDYYNVGTLVHKIAKAVGVTP